MPSSVEAFLEHLRASEPVMYAQRCGTRSGPLAPFPVTHLLGPPPTRAALKRLRANAALDPELVELWSRHDGMLLYCDAQFPPERLYTDRERRDDVDGLVNDSSFLRFERIADWDERRERAAHLNELGELGFTRLDAVPFASVSESSDAFFWAPDGVHAFSDGGKHKRVATSFAGFLRWLVEDPVRAVMSTASVARFHRKGHQYYPVRFTSG